MASLLQTALPDGADWWHSRMRDVIDRIVGQLGQCMQHAWCACPWHTSDKLADSDFDCVAVTDGCALAPHVEASDLENTLSQQQLLHWRVWGTHRSITSRVDLGDVTLSDIRVAARVFFLTLADSQHKQCRPWLADELYTRLQACCSVTHEVCLAVLSEVQSLCFGQCYMMDLTQRRRKPVHCEMAVDLLALGIKATRALRTMATSHPSARHALHMALLQWPVIVHGDGNLLSVPPQAAVVVLTLSVLRTCKWVALALGRNPALVVASVVSLRDYLRHCSVDSLARMGVEREEYDNLNTCLDAAERVLSDAIFSADAQFMDVALRGGVLRLENFLDTSVFDDPEPVILDIIMRRWHAFIPHNSVILPPEDGEAEKEWAEVATWVARWSLVRKAWVTSVVRVGLARCMAMPVPVRGKRSRRGKRNGGLA
jgi:hypothetical protein